MEFHVEKLQWAAIAFLITISPAYSCSRPVNPPTVKQAYENSKNVYLAFAVSIKNEELVLQNKQKITQQEVVFRVIEAWKGNIKIGQEVKFTSTLLDGSCGVSATNEPGWLEEEPADDSLIINPSYPRMSGVWLIYEYRDGEHFLSTLTRNSPIEYGGAGDLQELYKLSGKLN